MEEKLFQWVDQNQNKLISILQSLLRQPSIASTNTGIEECAQLMMRIMQDAGIETNLYRTDGSPILIGTIQGKSDKTILVYGHYDVQPPDPVELWEHDPFGAEIVDGKIFSRGAIDDKGNIMCAINAVRSFKACGKEFPVNAIFLIEGEEEVSSPSLPKFLIDHKDLLKADALLGIDDAVQPDGKIGRPKVVTGEKGNCGVELVCKINREFHSMYAPLIVNPAWRLVWALSTIKDQNEKILIDNFYDTIRENTPEEHKIIEMMDEYWNGDDWLIESGQSEYLGGVTGIKALKRLYFEPTCNIQGIKGGYIGEGRKTIIPEKCSVKIDFRTVPGQTSEQIVDLLRRHLDRRGFHDIEVVYTGGSRWFRSPVDHPAALALRKAIENGFGTPPSVMVTFPGSGPGDTFEEILNIPQVFTGFGPLGERAHAPNEFISIDFYLKGTKTIICFFEEFARVQEKGDRS